MAQPSSGAYNFQPALADYIIEAFSRIQIRPTSITAQHMHDAVMSANFLQSEWTSESGPNLWTVQLISIPLVQGTSTYTLPITIDDLLDVYLRLPSSGTQTTDIVVSPISRTEYADQPNKALQARPTTYWWDRQIQSTITMWPTPDQNGPYTLYLYVESQIQDATLPQGSTPNIPYRFYEAFAAGLAAKLAVKYPPAGGPMAAIQMAQMAWENAANKDIEHTPLFIIPGLSAYRGD
jgi:hypothetical protein